MVRERLYRCFPHFCICSHDVVVIRTIHACKSLWKLGSHDKYRFCFFGKYRLLLSLSKTWKQGSDWLAQRSSERDRLSSHRVALIGDDFNEIICPSICLSVPNCALPCLQDSLKDFHESWVTCSPHQGNIKSRIHFHFHKEDHVINK